MKRQETQRPVTAYRCGGCGRTTPASEYERFKFTLFCPNPKCPDPKQAYSEVVR